MTILILLLLLLIIGSIIGVGVYSSRKKNTERKYYAAAARIKKEEALERKLKGLPQIAVNNTVMVYLEWKTGEKQGYVFDPAPGIRIGRNHQRNTIAVQDRTVSAEHCEIFLYENQVYLRDVGSSNGTWHCGAFRSRPVTEPCLLASGDSFLVGSVRFRIHLFYFDATLL